MSRIIYRKPEKHDGLAGFLEGYLFGLGEVCHSLFGPNVEPLIYRAIGRHYLDYLAQKVGMVFDAPEPWERYCKIIQEFTNRGFYDYVELESTGENSYRMLESRQFARQFWEEQGSWESGSPPCPLWSVILASLEQIGFQMVVDRARFLQDRNALESFFHFEEIKKPAVDEHPANGAVPQELVPICANCSKIRLPDGSWMDIDLYLARRHRVDFTHSLCAGCTKELYPDLELARNS